MTVTPEELQILCDTTVKLVELRQRNCPHLSVENIAPEIMGSLIAATQRAKESRSDTERLDWMMYNISGFELRRLGISVDANCTRANLDEAILRTKEHGQPDSAIDGRDGQSSHGPTSF